MQFPPAGSEGIRFAKPAAATTKKAIPKEGLVRELYKKSPYPVWNPSFSVAFRLLILVRVWSAMYSSVTADCDEVYNYWEPLHFLLKGDAFRTWEYSSEYAIRSWAYIALHVIPAKIFSHLNASEKRLPFFTVRIALAALSALCESKLYRSIAENISPRIGRYTLFFLLGSAGMYNSATTFLPSSFSMHFAMLGAAFAMEPVGADRLRSIRATTCFAVAAIVGWPFSILLAVPFVLEDLLLAGQQTSFSPIVRFGRLLQGGLVGLALMTATCAVDSYFYGRLVVVPWNIIKYNVFPTSAATGPELYGTEPWYYYLLNGLLNFNIVLPLALLSLPALFAITLFERKKLAITKPGQTSAPVLLAFRLSPLYIWFTVLSLQPHKEERFMFPAFPLICFGAAFTVGMIRAAMEAIFVNITRAPFRAARTPIYRYVTVPVIVLTSFISIARVLALQHYFRSPMPILFHLQYTELPTLAIHTYPAHYPKLNLTNYQDAEEQMDISILSQMNLTLCYGKEWYRFPSSFLVPDELRTEFIKSDFDGILPKHFVERRDAVAAVRRSYVRSKAEITRQSPPGFNNVNREELDRYVPVESCSYLVDLDFPKRHLGVVDNVRKGDQRYTVDTEHWDRMVCYPFLDAEHSPRLSRSFYFPFVTDKNTYGEYCLLRNKRIDGPPPKL